MPRVAREFYQVGLAVGTSAAVLGVSLAGAAVVYFAVFGKPLFRAESARSVTCKDLTDAYYVRRDWDAKYLGKEVEVAGYTRSYNPVRLSGDHYEWCVELQPGGDFPIDQAAVVLCHLLENPGFPLSSLDVLSVRAVPSLYYLVVRGRCPNARRDGGSPAVLEAGAVEFRRVR